MHTVHVEPISIPILPLPPVTGRDHLEPPYWQLDLPELINWSDYYKRELGLGRYWEAVHHCLSETFWTDKK